MNKKADHQFTMERVDYLAKTLAKEEPDFKYYGFMCSKMADWIRNRDILSGRLVCKHFGLSAESYIEIRDDTNDEKIGSSFLEHPTVHQTFTMPPQYKSLSKDTSKLETKEGVLELINDVFSQVREMLQKYKDSIEIQEHKFKMFYYFMVKDAMLMRHSIDFNDVKRATLKLEILDDPLLVAQISEFEEEAYNMFKNNFEEI